MDLRVVIPARFESSRLPGKPLAPIAGKPMIQHVWQRAVESGAAAVIIATDDERIVKAAADFGADAMMTDPTHPSGTDRVAEVALKQGWGDDTPIVNLQGDAPLIPPQSIRQAAELLQAHASASIATLCVGIRDRDEYMNPHVVKVVFDNGGRALYFSRSPIPADSHGGNERIWSQAWRHIGMYAYRASALKVLTSSEPCELELAERLEQLRALWLGMEIRVGIARETQGPDVDTPDDLAEVEAALRAAGKFS